MTVADALESLGPRATVGSVTAATGLPWRRVRREWLELWLAGAAPAPRQAPLGGTPRRPARAGGPLTAEQSATLDRLIREHPDEWAREIADRFAAETGRAIHKATVGQRRCAVEAR